MNKEPLVSVVIPAYNASVFLDRSIRSVLAQKDILFELIIVDNNSVDNTVEIAKGYLTDFPEVIHLLHQPIQGVAAARNMGVKHARGKYVQFLDADDMLLPDKFIRQVRFFEENESIDYVLGASYEQDLDGKMVLQEPSKDAWIGLVTGAFGHTNANLYSKDIIDSIGGQDESMKTGEDVDMLFRLLKLNPNYYIDVFPGSIHIHHDGPRLSRNSLRNGLVLSILRDQQVMIFLSVARPSYFVSNRSKYDSHFLRKLRMLATLDFSKAISLHDAWFQSSEKYFIDYAILPRFAFFYNFFGFVFTERTRLFLARILPVGLKKWIKNV